jgi:hypothetical protein
VHIESAYDLRLSQLTEIRCPLQIGEIFDEKKRSAPYNSASAEVLCRGAGEWKKEVSKREESENL